METIRLAGGLSLAPYTLGLTPGGDFVGFVGANMKPASGDGETVEQVINIEFGSSQGNIESGMLTLGRVLEEAAEEATKPNGNLVYLECQVVAGGPFWRSLVYGGRLELGGAGADLRANGNQVGVLHLVRANWWEAVTETTLVNNQVITNHRDAGHSNLATVNAQAGDQDLAGAVRLVATLSTAVTAPAGLLVGMRGGSPGALDLFYEGEDGAARAGVTGTVTADAGSSNGSYYNLAWNGAAETELWQVDINAANTGKAKGKPFRPVVRLGDSISTSANEKMWSKWVLAYVDAGGVERVLYESPGAYLDQGKELLFGPVLYLPPWVPLATTPDLRVILKAAAAGAGAHSLKLDYVDFAPLDGWRQYEPALQSYGVSVEDRGQAGMAGPAGGLITHAMEGPGFAIAPGFAHQFQFYFYVREAAEVSASANLEGTASIYYRPRKRVL